MSVHPTTEAVLDPPVEDEKPGFFQTIFSGTLWKSIFFLISGFPFLLFWFIVLIVFTVVSTALLVTLIGIPLIAVSLTLWVSAASAERWRFRTFLGVDIPASYRPVKDEGIFPHIKTRLGDGAVWKNFVYFLVAFPLGVIGFCLAVVLLAVTVFFLFLPVKITSAVLAWMTRLQGGIARSLLGSDRVYELEQRVETLTESRSRVMEAVAEERRRIERDLHDGAQQRLVALAMDLGMAKEKISKDPESARLLVEEAHDHAKRALSEMRELVRGIHPAVLSDRGLDAAISAVAGRSQIPVTVQIDLPDRLPPAIETNAYFMVVEALTNIAKHSGATKARVFVRLEGPLAVVEIADDGKGGADFSKGSGLAGLRDRIEGLDGRLRISSPAGGPTWLRAEIPMPRDAK